MPQVTCVFCAEPGPEADDLFEAADDAVEVAGFIRIEVVDRKNPSRKRPKFLCPHCTTYARAYFLSEKPKAENILIPLELDSDFEDDTAW